jgi:hypothetical protein
MADKIKPRIVRGFRLHREYLIYCFSPTFHLGKTNSCNSPRNLYL